MELINKEEAIALIKAEMDKIPTHNLVDGTARINLRLAKNIIEDMPTIDIVRCKECRWGKPYSDKQLECDALGLGGLKFPNDFCSYGEREGE